MRPKLRRVLSGTLAVTLCVALNINPIATLGTALVESGIIDKASIIGQNIARMIDEHFSEVHATSLPLFPGLDPIGTIDAASCDCPDYSSILNDINFNLEYEDGSQLDKIRRDTTVIKGYSEDLLEVTNSIDATTKAILQDTHYIIEQLGYDPQATGVQPKNVKESFERVSEQLDQLSHEYRVANIKSINNMFASTLWKPKFDEIPNLTEYCEITGGFANTYSGYWDTSYDDTAESVLPTEKALEELGYDAIIRAEGVIPQAAVIQLGADGDQTEVNLAVPYGEAPGSSGLNVANEAIVYDEQGNIDLVYNDWGQVTDSYNISELIPTSQMIKYEVITMPSSNITYLDAVTVLYKALGEEIVTLEGIYTRNPEIEVESSPLARGLSGVVDTWEGYDYYVFATRSNPISYEISGGHILQRYDYVYWKKAVTAGFVNYNLRDEPISAVDFCTLAAKMMEAYGEPAFTDDELHTLLQVHGSSYPIQMGDKIASSWAYLKARGIITDDNFPEVYTDYLSRNQLLDMCARIKNPDLRDTYKNIQLAITLDDVVVDDGVYPYYDFSIDTGANFFLETTIDYTTLTHYTYLFPMTTNENSVNLGYGGTGFVFDSLEFNSIIPGAMYNGMVKLDDTSGGHYYYVVQIPKDYEGNAYLRFIDYNEPTRDLGTVAAIELNPNYMWGGIFTQYEVSNENDAGIMIATLLTDDEQSNWYSFATQPNNMDLIWYGDVIRCNDVEGEEPEPSVAKVTRSNPTFGERIEVFWNNLTEPMTVLAADPNANGTTPSTENTWTFNRDIVESSGTMDGSIDTHGADLDSYLIKQNYVDTKNAGRIYYYNDTNKSLYRAINSKALVYIARASMMSDFNFSEFREEYNTHFYPSSTGMNPLYLQYQTITPALDALLSVHSNNKKTTDSNGNDVYLLDIAKKHFDGSSSANGYTAEDFPALFHLAANGLDNGEQSSGSDFNETLWDKDVISNLRGTSSMNSHLQMLFIKEDGFKTTNVSTDGKVTASANDSTVLKAYANTIASYLENDFFDSVGAIGLEDANFASTLETSVLMDRDNQIFISWEEMVRYGIARDIDEDGKPLIPNSDGVYEFLTHNGVVRVDDVNKIIQIGTQLYSFQYENDPPHLVHNDSTGKTVYFDIRCITGVSNSAGYTLDAGKATVQEKLIGAGDYTILCLNANGMTNSGSMKTREVIMYPYSEYIDAPKYTEQKIDIIVNTIYDGQTAVNNTAGNAGTTSTTPFRYWYDDKGTSDINDDTIISDTQRMTLASTVPTANWIFVTYDDGMTFGGRLYVFYLKQAFEEGFLDVDGNLTKVEPTQAFIDEWNGPLYSNAMTRLAANYPTLRFTREFEKIYGDGSGSAPDWPMIMTRCALANLAADTGVIWSSCEYYVRVFDLTNASAAYNTYQTDFTESELSIDHDTEYDKSNKPGSVYFLDYLGYIYNIPTVEDFSLTDYYSGKFPLPIAATGGGTILNYNFNYYGETNSAFSIGPDGVVSLPLGVDLNSYGFVRYGNNGTGGPLPKEDALYESGGIELKKDLFNANSTATRVEPPYAVSSEEPDPSIVRRAFTAAPAGVYMRYGLFRNTDYDKKLSDISQSITNIDEFYIGTRRVSMSSDSTPNADVRYWTYGSDVYGPISISSNYKAELCHKYLSNATTITTTNAYIINTNNIQPAFMMDMGNITTLGMTTPEIEWEGRAELVDFLNTIDKGTNWWIWVCLTLAPMICVILMTILIGMSFITESQLWQKFCEHFFDPVRLFTFGATDSQHWVWRRVLIPCIITYIAFALLCNANILKIIIYVVDAWMKLVEVIG